MVNKYLRDVLYGTKRAASSVSVCRRDVQTADVSQIRRIFWICGLTMDLLHAKS